MKSTTTFIQLTTRITLLVVMCFMLVPVTASGQTNETSGTLAATDVASHGGAIYTTGYINDRVDLDPGPDTVIHEAQEDEQDIYITKLGADGEYEWSAILDCSGFSNSNLPWAIETDSMGNVYTCGLFTGSVDFDASDGVAEVTARVGPEPGHYDAFLCKYTPNREFLWAITWGSERSDSGLGIAFDSNDDVYILGRLGGEADFDPGPGETTVSGSTSLSKYTSNGEFLWVRTWDSCEGSDLAADSTGNVYLLGYYMESISLDPDNPQQVFTTNGDFDSFLCSLESDGDFRWFEIYSSPADEMGESISIDRNDHLFIGMNIGGELTISFPDGDDPEYTIVGPGVSVIEMTGDGNYVSSTNWSEGTDYISNPVVEANTDLGFVIAGNFRGTTDFDPGEPAEYHSATAQFDIFLAGISDGGDLSWLHTLGGKDYNYISGLTIDESGNVYVVGEVNYIKALDRYSNLNNYDIEEAMTFLCKIGSDSSIEWMTFW